MIKSTTAIVAYGSLINPLELVRRRHLYRQADPVRVQGFLRRFSQEPSWRLVQSEKRAVLRVDPHEGHSFNGLLLPLDNESDLAMLDKREAGYRRMMLRAEQVRHFDTGTEFQSALKIFVYVGKAEKLNLTIRPNPDYLSLCLDGAGKWGENFYREFLLTTLVGNKRLKEILE